MIPGSPELLTQKLCSLSEWNQRASVFGEEIASVSPELACGLFSDIIASTVRMRTIESTVVAQSAFLSILGNRWPLEHQMHTREAAAAWSDHLTLSFLVGRPCVEEDDETFTVPGYNSERPLTLGERKSIAGSPRRRSIELALNDPHPAVALRLLDNPKITEPDVIRMAARHRIPRAILVTLASHPKWRERPGVLNALANNRLLPVAYGLTLLPFLDQSNLRSIQHDNRLVDTLRIAAGRLLAVAATSAVPSTDRERAH